LEQKIEIRELGTGIEIRELEPKFETRELELKNRNTRTWNLN
jgi:hypothetical protein